MSKIGNGGNIPNKPIDTSSVGERREAQKSGTGETAKPGSKPLDSFQRVESKLQELGGPQLTQKLSFTNADLAVLAQQFSLIVRNNPNADRLKRAKLFAKAILKKKGAKVRGKLAELLDDEN